MTSSFISTNSLTTTLRLAAMNSQVQLTKASKEVTTGRSADVGLDLGALTGRDIVLRAEVDRIGKIIDTNGTVSGRLDASQAALTSLSQTAQDFVQQLLAARQSQDGAQVIMPQAKTNLSDLVSTLNTTLFGQYIFAGINTGQKPMADYVAGSNAKVAVDNAFLTDFGMTQSSGTVNTITPAQMQTFLDTTFANLFADPAWGNDWSTASNQVQQTRISTTETIDTSASSNEQGIRKLAMVYTMMSDLGTQNMSQSTFQTVIDNAVKIASDAVTDLTQVQATLGTAQQRTTDANSKMQIQQDLLTKQATAMETVDPNEASVRVNALQTQAETALALIAKIQNLSILNYM